MESIHLKDETILLNEHWREELKSLPLVSHVSHSFTSNLFFRKKEKWWISSSRNPRSVSSIGTEKHLRLLMYLSKGKSKKKLRMPHLNLSRQAVLNNKMQRRQRRFSPRFLKNMMLKWKRSENFYQLKLFNKVKLWQIQCLILSKSILSNDFYISAIKLILVFCMIAFNLADLMDLFARENMFSIGLKSGL